MIKKISYERRVYESVDDNSLSKAISQKTDEKNKSYNQGLKNPRAIKRKRSQYIIMSVVVTVTISFQANVPISI